MNSARYDRRITIEKKIVTQDTTDGTEVVTWQSIAAPFTRIWASKKDALPSRSEAVRQGLTVARNQTVFRIRYRDGVDSSMRLVEHGNTDVIYNIVGGPAEIGRREELEMVCERYSTQGG